MSDNHGALIWAYIDCISWESSGISAQETHHRISSEQRISVAELGGLRNNRIIWHLASRTNTIEVNL